VKCMETRSIKLPVGGTLEVEMSEAFIDRIKKQFGLMDDERVTDDMVRMFVWGAVNTAVNKVESNSEGTRSTF
jgi:hypothetical protein